jgi:hypothetical protein
LVVAFLPIFYAPGGCARPRQVLVADQRRPDVAERRIAEDVVGMHMGVYQEADRFWGHLPYRGDEG